MAEGRGRLKEALHVGRALAFETPSCSRAIACALIFVYTAGRAHTGLEDFLALTPERVLPHMWTLVTAAFFPRAILDAATGAVGMLATGRVLEPVWGSMELLRFLLFVGACCGGCMLVILYLLYVAMQSEVWVHEHFGGFFGPLAGLLIAVCHVSPEEEALYSVRCRHVPFIFILACVILVAATGNLILWLDAVVYPLCGAYFAWLYLRFVQFDPATGDRGDEAFSLHSLFPEPVRPVVQAVTKPFAKLLLPSRQGERSKQASLPVSYARPPSSSDEDDGEHRRRQERGERLVEGHLQSDESY